MDHWSTSATQCLDTWLDRHSKSWGARPNQLGCKSVVIPILALQIHGSGTFLRIIHHFWVLTRGMLIIYQDVYAPTRKLQMECKWVKSRRCSPNMACSAPETEMSWGGWNILNIATMSADGYSTSCLVCILPGQKLNFVAEGQHQGEAEHPSAPHRKLILCSFETLLVSDLAVSTNTIALNGSQWHWITLISWYCTLEYMHI